jgi:hypothetical protein
VLGVPEVTYRLLEHGGECVSKNPQLRQDSFSQLVDKHAQAFAAHPVRGAEVHVDHAVQSWIDGSTRSGGAPRGSGPAPRTDACADYRS